jgi:hypothetical protein
MNTQNTPNAPANGVENERTVRDKIVEYLYRVGTVGDPVALLLLQQAADALQKRVDQPPPNVTARDPALNNILQQMQTSIAKLEAKSSYSEVVRKATGPVQAPTPTMRVAKETVPSSGRNRQAREFTVTMTDVVEKKNLEVMSTKDIMSKLQGDAEGIRGVARLANGAIRIQAESAEARKALQEKPEVIKRLGGSATVRCRTYHVRVNGVKVDHINTANQAQAIAYLQQANARLHPGLVIKKVSWSAKTLREGKVYSTLHMEVGSVQAANRLLTEGLLEDFEVKQCERFTKGCTMLQCMNCHRYGHVAKYCRTLTTCGTCAGAHRTSDCDPTTTGQYKKCAACGTRGHVAWDPSCKVRMEERKKAEKTRAERARLYTVEGPESSRPVVITEEDMEVAQRAVPRGWTLVEAKKRKMERAGISPTREMVGNASQAKAIAPMGPPPDPSSWAEGRAKDPAGPSSWAETEIMKPSNRERAMTKRPVGRPRSVSRPASAISHMDDTYHDSDVEV